MCQRNLTRILFISIGVYFLCNGANVTNNIASQVLGQDGFGNLGFYALGAQQLTFGGFSLVTGRLIKKLGYRLSFLLGLCTCLAYMSA